MRVAILLAHGTCNLFINVLQNIPPDLDPQSIFSHTVCLWCPWAYPYSSCLPSNLDPQSMFSQITFISSLFLLPSFLQIRLWESTSRMIDEKRFQAEFLLIMIFCRVWFLCSGDLVLIFTACPGFPKCQKLMNYSCVGSPKMIPTNIVVIPCNH